ncbi:HU family DNA-binding protein [Castellaniella hirudinis]|uniref:HU family DNA-binding protein n=1 Tax=Castellaniella hirudinis TaxID=1144617 RepID=UPI0039C34221
MALTKKELITTISDLTGQPKAAVQAVLMGIRAVLVGKLGEGDELALPDIGKFHVAERAARTGRNPRTGETVEIEAKRVVKFTPAKSLKDAAA